MATTAAEGTNGVNASAPIPEEYRRRASDLAAAESFFNRWKFLIAAISAVFGAGAAYGAVKYHVATKADVSVVKVQLDVLQAQVGVNAAIVSAVQHEQESLHADVRENLRRQDQLVNTLLLSPQTGPSIAVARLRQPDRISAASSAAPPTQPKP